MSRSVRIYIGLAVLLALSLLFLFSVVHTAAGASRPSQHKVSAGYHLAQVWCQSCHAIEPGMAGFFDLAPSFQAVADRNGTTALSLKVFWKTSHHDMPNLVIAPDQADALSDYILSLKRN